MSTPNSNPDPRDPDNRPQYGQNAPGQPQYGQNAPGQPQYGQNAPGQPQYGQAPQQNPYGYPGAGSNSPGGNYPGGMNQAQPAGKGAPPREVMTAFWLIIAAGVVNLISMIITASSPSTGLSPMQRQQLETGGMDPASAAGIISTVIIIFGVIALALYVLLAFFIRKGHNWARITATVLAVLSILNLFTDDIVMILAVLLGIAGVVMTYLKPSRPYFRKVPRGYAQY